jgi:predicted nucleic acid-binding Zn ribbon protein
VSGRKRKPERLDAALASFLEGAGIAGRVEQASIVPEWGALVGPQISRVTEPLSVTPDGTLFVAVSTNAWMNELSLMEPELLRTLNARGGRVPIAKIRWLLKR